MMMRSSSGRGGGLGIRRVGRTEAAAAVVLIACSLAGAAVIRETELDLDVDPNGGTMAVKARLHVAENAGEPNFVGYFLKPARMEYLRDANSGRDVPYAFEQVPPMECGVYTFTMNLAGLPQECTLELAYSHTKDSFYAYYLNPSTTDNLVYGQITRDSIYSSHLFYYPSPEVGTGTGRVSITVPQGWTGVTSGILKSQEPLDDGRRRFTYEIPFASGMLPYPLAVYPYVVEETTYRDRVPVSIYCSADDLAYAKEKMERQTTKILPFLEEILGDYPWPTLRIVEVFPREGNTGLATKGLVMLSKAVWFSAVIGDSYTSPPATSLVDEMAHQWNAYRVQLPNYLAEGVSQYTDDLSMERFAGRDTYVANMAAYRESYTGLVIMLDYLKSCHDKGQTVEQAAATLGLPASAFSPLWPYAPFGELPISDPRIFPPLYFIKGALALDALRTEIGDEQFFKGFKAVFAGPADQLLTLDYFRGCFETVHGASLEAFFHLWYEEPGLPSR